MDGANVPKKSKRAASSGDLTLPTATVELRARFGSSVIDQFVQAHEPADGFRELVQNEFDAQGSEITMHFGNEILSVSGSGRPVNAQGWKRLQVIMGTGITLGDGERENIEAKRSGIGSKNFGIRSLFLFGNRINARSNGKLAVIDMEEFGAGVAADPATARRNGILIQVPYRKRATRSLPVFTVDRENGAMDQIEAALLPTLVKLANSGKGPGINALTVISDRTGRELRWRQTAKAINTKVPGVTVTQRNGRLQSVHADGARSSTTNEQLEFSTLVTIPFEHIGVDFPSYYRSGRRLKVAVSIQMKGKLPDLSHRGRLYYPLEAGLAFTGMAVSASAPFQLDAERNRAIPSAWNTWLLTECATLVVKLVGADWFSRFGVLAFSAVSGNGQGVDPLQALVQKGLASAVCWPSQKPGNLAKAGELHVLNSPELAPFILDEQTLNTGLAGAPATRALAITSGAFTFSISSLVRLRCGDGSAFGWLITKPQPKETNFCHPGGAADLPFQISTASALTKLEKELSSQNRQDLRNTATTLAADGTTLKAAKDLILVPADMHATCPVPASDRLHPKLNGYVAVSKFCQRFNIADWMIQAVDRATPAPTPPPQTSAASLPPLDSVTVSK